MHKQAGRGKDCLRSKTAGTVKMSPPVRTFPKMPHVPTCCPHREEGYFHHLFFLFGFFPLAQTTSICRFLFSWTLAPRRSNAPPRHRRCDFHEQEAWLHVQRQPNTGISGPAYMGNARYVTCSIMSPARFRLGPVLDKAWQDLHASVRVLGIALGIRRASQ